MPVVLFDGANDWISQGSPSYLPSTTRFTWVMRFRPLSVGSGVHGIGPGLLFWNATTLWPMILGEAGWAPGLESAPFALGDWVSLMVAGDTSGGLSGGRSVTWWVDGAELAHSTTPSAGPFVFDPGWGQYNQFFAHGDFIANHPAAEVEQIWLSKDTALDPAVHWDDFFNGDGTLRTLASGGVVGGVTPELYLKGRASLWNGGEDLNGNPFVMHGAVTDVGGDDGEADGDILTVTASLLTGSASGERSATVEGQMLTAAASVLAGAASAGTVTPGDMLAAAASLVGGSAGGQRSPTVDGRTLAVTAILAAGAASGAGPPIASHRERVLQALLAALDASKPAGATLLRNAVLPERIPAAGLMILRDGDPGEPEFLFSPLRYFYEHRAEIDVLVDGAPASRDTAFERILQTIAQALAANRTLGGLVDYAIGEAPVPLDLPVEGAAGLKAASIGILLPYDTSDPLA